MPLAPAVGSVAIGVGPGVMTLAVLIVTAGNAFLCKVGTVVLAEEALHEPGSSTVAVASGSSSLSPHILCTYSF